MKTFFYAICILSAVWTGGGVLAQNRRPEIAHEGPSSVVSGQPMRIVARVRSTGALQSVTLHLAQSGGAAPVKIPMQASGAGVYSVKVDPRYFAGAESFRYYIDARTRRGSWNETNWMTVRVVGQAAEGENEKDAWVRPAVIGGGAVLAVGAGVALAGSGGGGDDNGGGDTGGGDGNPADKVIVRSRSAEVDAPDPGLPAVTVLDISDELAGRTIDRVRTRLEFDAVDGGAEQVEITYNGSTVLSATVSTTLTDQTDVLGAADTQVVFRVVDSTPAGGTSTYRWTLTATFFLE